MKPAYSGSAVLALCAVAFVARPAVAEPPVRSPSMTSESRNSRHHMSPAAIAREIQAGQDYKDGSNALRAKDYASAVASFQAALSNRPDGPPYLGLAEALVGQGKTAEALQAYWSVFHPDAHNSWGGSYYPRAQLEYALLLNQTGQWAEAVAMYEKALPNVSDRGMATINAHFDPAVPQPVALEAAARIGLGLEADWAGGEPGDFGADRAFQEYAKALQLQPNWAVANYYYGYGWQKLSPAETAKFGNAALVKAALQKAAALGTGDVKKNAEELLKAFAPLR